MENYITTDGSLVVKSEPLEDTNKTIEEEEEDEEEEEEEEDSGSGNKKLILSFDLNVGRTAVSEKETFRSWDWKRKSHRSHEDVEKEESGNMNHMSKKDNGNKINDGGKEEQEEALKEVISSPQPVYSRAYIAGPSTPLRDEECFYVNENQPSEGVHTGHHDVVDTESKTSCQDANVHANVCMDLRTKLDAAQQNRSMESKSIKKIELRKKLSFDGRKSFSQIIFVSDGRFSPVKEWCNIRVYTRSGLMLGELEDFIGGQDVDFNVSTLLLCCVGVYDILKVKSGDHSEDNDLATNIVEKAKAVRLSLLKRFPEKSEVHYLRILPIDWCPTVFGFAYRNSPRDSMRNFTERCYVLIQNFNEYVKSISPQSLLSFLDRKGDSLSTYTDFTKQFLTDGFMLSDTHCIAFSKAIDVSLHKRYKLQNIYERAVLIGDARLEGIVNFWPKYSFDCTVLISSDLRLCHFEKVHKLRKELCAFRNSLFVIHLGILDLYQRRSSKCSRCGKEVECFLPKTLVTSKSDMLLHIKREMDTAERVILEMTVGCGVTFALCYPLDVITRVKHATQEHSKNCNNADILKSFNNSPEVIEEAINNAMFVIYEFNKLALEHCVKNEIECWNPLSQIYGKKYKSEDPLTTHGLADTLKDGINPCSDTAQSIAKHYYRTLQRQELVARCAKDNWTTIKQLINSQDFTIDKKNEDTSKKDIGSSVERDGEPRTLGSKVSVTINYKEAAKTNAPAVSSEKGKMMNYQQNVSGQRIITTSELRTAKARKAVPPNGSPIPPLPPPYPPPHPPPPPSHPPPHPPPPPSHPPHPPSHPPPHPPPSHPHPHFNYPPPYNAAAPPFGQMFPEGPVQSCFNLAPINLNVEAPPFAPHFPAHGGPPPPYHSLPECYPDPLFNPPHMGYPPPPPPVPMPPYSVPDMPFVQCASFPQAAVGNEYQQQYSNSDCNTYDANAQQMWNSFDNTSCQSNLNSIPITAQCGMPSTSASPSGRAPDVQNPSYVEDRPLPPTIPTSYKMSALQDKLSVPSGPASSKRCKKPTKRAAHTKSLEEKALMVLREVHNREIERYKKQPKAHPDYKKEFEIFCSVKVQRILEHGGNPDVSEIEKIWNHYWKVRLVQLLEENWIRKRDECLKAIGKETTQSALLSDLSAGSSDDSSSSCSSPGRFSDDGERTGCKGKKRRRVFEELNQWDDDMRRSWSRSPPPVVSDRVKEVYSSKRVKQSAVNSRSEFRHKSQEQKIDLSKIPIPQSSKREKINIIPLPEPQQGTKVSRIHGQKSRERLDIKEIPLPSIRTMDVTRNIPLPQSRKREQDEAFRGHKSSPQAKKRVSLWKAIGELDDKRKDREKRTSKEKGRIYSESGSKKKDKVEMQKRTSDKWDEKHHKLSKYEQSKRDADVKTDRHELRDILNSPKTSKKRIEPDLKPTKSDRQLGSEYETKILEYLKKYDKNANSTGSKGKQMPDQGPQLNRKLLDDYEKEILKRLRKLDGDTSGENLPSNDVPPKDVACPKKHHANSAMDLGISRSNLEKVSLLRSDCKKKAVDQGVDSSLLSSSVTKNPNEIFDVFEVLNRFGDALGTMQDPLRHLHATALHLRSSGSDISDILRDNDNVTLLFLVSSRLKKASSSSSVSIVQKVIMQEVTERLDSLLESIPSDVSVRDIALQCFGKCDSEIVECIVREVTKSAKSEVSTEYVLNMFKAVKIEQAKLVGSLAGTSELNVFASPVREYAVELPLPKKVVKSDAYPVGTSESTRNAVSFGLFSGMDDAQFDLGSVWDSKSPGSSGNVINRGITDAANSKSLPTKTSLLDASNFDINSLELPSVQKFASRSEKTAIGNRLPSDEVREIPTSSRSDYSMNLYSDWEGSDSPLPQQRSFNSPIPQRRSRSPSCSFKTQGMNSQGEEERFYSRNRHSSDDRGTSDGLGPSKDSKDVSLPEILTALLTKGKYF